MENELVTTRITEETKSKRKEKKKQKKKRRIPVVGTGTGFQGVGVGGGGAWRGERAVSTLGGEGGRGGEARRGSSIGVNKASINAVKKS